MVVWSESCGYYYYAVCQLKLEAWNPKKHLRRPAQLKGDVMAPMTAPQVAPARRGVFPMEPELFRVLLAPHLMAAVVGSGTSTPAPLGALQW